MGLTYKHRDDISNNDTDITNLQNGKNFISIILKSVASQVWTNEPAALTEILGTTENRVAVDLTNVTQYRLMVNLLVLNPDPTTSTSVLSLLIITAAAPLQGLLQSNNLKGEATIRLCLIFSNVTSRP